MANFDSQIHKWILNDEFKIKDFNMEQVKCLLEGRIVESTAKFKDTLNIKIRCPIIFLSNNKPPKRDEVPGFYERFKIVEFDKGIYYFKTN